MSPRKPRPPTAEEKASAHRKLAQERARHFQHALADRAPPGQYDLPPVTLPDLRRLTLPAPAPSPGKVPQDLVEGCITALCRACAHVIERPRGAIPGPTDRVRLGVAVFQDGRPVPGHLLYGVDVDAEEPLPLLRALRATALKLPVGATTTLGVPVPWLDGPLDRPPNAAASVVLMGAWAPSVVDREDPRVLAAAGVKDGRALAAWAEKRVAAMLAAHARVQREDAAMEALLAAVRVEVPPASLQAALQRAWERVEGAAARGWTLSNAEVDALQTAFALSPAQRAAAEREVRLQAVLKALGEKLDVTLDEPAAAALTEELFALMPPLPPDVLDAERRQRAEDVSWRAQLWVMQVRRALVAAAGG